MAASYSAAPPRLRPPGTPRAAAPAGFDTVSVATAFLESWSGRSLHEACGVKNDYTPSNDRQRPSQSAPRLREGTYKSICAL